MSGDERITVPSGRMAAFTAGVAAYLLPAALLFGNPLKPIAFLTVWRDRLGTPDLWIALAAGLLCAVLVATLMRRRAGLRPWSVPAGIAVSMIGIPLALAAMTEARRSEIMAAFGADSEIRAPFLASLREAPREFQFHLHGAALKDCVTYAWSYRSMSYYELPPNVAVNVLPSDWVERCGIIRS